MSKAQDAYEKMMQQGKIKKPPKKMMGENLDIPIGRSGGSSALMEILAEKIKDLEKRIKLLEGK